MPNPQSPDPDTITNVISRHTALRPLSGHDLRGVCPFCGSTAFRVRPAFDTFYCFGCGEGGDIRAFIAKIENRDPVT
ncbi:CHC2 zinc finger domain-containing protein [Kibdelosporangium philippinense]|uniref:CHC2 zinc finger domain-containing protein n=1 Tax=Kibdelosporangium philippinense TaxID=211113 RepID=A0ABS8Z148_9PSEU|nr:CHC2 zinc finger domain-containing protein [Kibdelosporangium philippinense]MCE7001651.1 CHC2 zinc finger domain-containing protein [Kibdelosporangium philippinense]